MKFINGWYLPDEDNYFAPFFEEDARGFQIERIEAAILLCKHRRIAIDGGAHVGTWAVAMALDFEYVHAFEPVPATYDCLLANLNRHEVGNVSTHNTALSDRAGTGIEKWDRAHQLAGNTGSRYVLPAVNGSGTLAMQTLDSLNLVDVDLLKLDVEGAELLALRGAEATIKRCAPIIVVELKTGYGARFGHADDASTTYLRSLGYTETMRMKNDRVFTVN